jgi:hypothetical protein
LFELVLRDQTGETAERAQKLWRTRASNNLEVSRTITPPVQELAVNRFLFDFVISPDSNGSYFSFVPEIYSRAPAGSSVDLALSAVASANFGWRSKCLQTQAQGLRAYGKALQRVNQALQEPKDQSTLDVTVAICLLAAHELIAVSTVTKVWSWSAHVNGASALLMRKYAENPSMRELADLLQPIMSKMLVHCLARGARPTIPLQVFLSLMAPQSSPAVVLTYTYRTAELCANWREDHAMYIDNEGQLVAKAASFVTKSLEFDEEMVTWMKASPEAQNVLVLENCDSNVPTWLRSLYSSPGAPAALQKYADIHVSHRWQYWRATRLTLLSAALTATETLLSSSESVSLQEHNELLKSTLELRMLDLIDDICEGAFTAFTISVPGKPEPQRIADVPGIRGYQLVWPLFRAGLCLKRPSLRQLDSNGRLKWICSTMSSIKNDLGFIRVQNFVNTLERQEDVSKSGYAV